MSHPITRLSKFCKPIRLKKPYVKKLFKEKSMRKRCVANTKENLSRKLVDCSVVKRFLATV